MRLLQRMKEHGASAVARECVTDEESTLLQIICSEMISSSTTVVVPLPRWGRSIRTFSLQINLRNQLFRVTERFIIKRIAKTVTIQAILA